MSANATSSCNTEQQQKVTVAYTNQPCRRKLQFINGKFAVQKPQTTTVQKRNERERNRVKLINRTFTILRDRLPPKYTGKKERKLSKVEVLKTATSYIAYLVRLLEEDDSKRKATLNASGSADQQQQNQQLYTYQNQIGQSATCLPSPCGDLADLLNDESIQAVPNQPHQQLSAEMRQAVPIGAVQDKKVNDISDEDDPESGIFQLSSEADFSSPGSLQQQQHQHQFQQQQPLMSHLQLLPVVPPPVNTSCMAVSTPIKPIVQDLTAFTGSISSSTEGSSGIELIGPAFFYPVTATAAAFTGIGSSIDCSTIGDSQEFQFVTISDLSDSYASYYQYF